MRDYETMRTLLLAARDATRPLLFTELADAGPRRSVVDELGRLRDEGLIDSSVTFLPGDVCEGGTLDGLTEPGKEFVRLVENPEVWRILSKVLRDAGLDLSYPLLRDVCETVVLRYVEGFIPGSL